MILYRYILKAHLGPFIFAFGTLVFLFLFQFLIKSIDQLVGKGLSIWVIIQLITLNLAWIVTLAVPMAVLVATLMAYGSLASDNEITIMKASGISLYKLMMPVVIASLILFYLMIKFNNDVLPDANHRARILLSDISKTKPTFILEQGKFSDDIGGFKILVKKTYANNNNLEDIYIYDFSNPAFRNLITAKKGDIGFTSDFKNIVMNLKDGEIHQLNNVDFNNKYRKVKFQDHRIIMDAKGFGFQQSGDNAFSRGDREMSAGDMNKIVDSLKKVQNNFSTNAINIVVNDVNKLSRMKFIDTTFSKKLVGDSILQSIDNLTVKTFSAYDTLKALSDGLLRKKIEIQNLKNSTDGMNKQIDSYEVEIYKKYSIPFACVVFTLLGAPLGYKVKKGGFGIASGLSLLFFLVYWASLIGGEKLADRDLFSPFLGMWIANIVLGVFGLYLIYKSS